MKKLPGYEKAQTYSDTERLPVGGYVVKILDVDYKTYSWGDVIVLSFDIIKGEYKDFFRRDYYSQTREDKKWRGTYRLRVPLDDGSEKDGWTMRRFKTTITDIEESNPGYHWDWDEKTLKGKTIGAIFNNKEYEIEGRRGFYTNCYGLTTIEKVESGNFKMPADTLLKNQNSSSTAPSSNDDFMNIPDGVEEELPF